MFTNCLEQFNNFANLTNFEKVENTLIRFAARHAILDSVNQEYTGVSIKSLYNFKNLLQRQMKRQMSGNYYRMRRVYLSFFFASFTIPLYGHH